MHWCVDHLADEEWRAVFMGENALLAPRGFGVAATPWRAVQRAAWEAFKKGERDALVAWIKGGDPA